MNQVKMRVITIFVMFSLMFGNTNLIGAFPVMAQASKQAASVSLDQQETTETPPVAAEEPTNIPPTVVVPTDVPPTDVPTDVPPIVAPTDVPPVVAPTEAPPTEVVSDTPTTEIATDTPVVEPTETVAPKSTKTPGGINRLQQLAQLTDCNSADVTSAECNALVALYNSAGGSTWTSQTNWLQTNTICSWFGVTCNGPSGGKYVEGLDLDTNNLIGSLPTELGNLTKVTFLNLSKNPALTGPIPSTVSSMIALRNLTLTGDNLTGGIPTGIGSLTNLNYLYLSGNANLAGTLPTQLGSLTQLIELKLGSDGLTGSIPTQLGGMTNLHMLDLNDNSLSGSVPSELGSLTHLTELDLSANAGLNGSLPYSFESLTSLTDLLFNFTGVCEPADTAFQNFLSGIVAKPGTVKGTSLCYVVSGTVKWNGTGLASIAMTLSGITPTVTSAADGSYNFYNVPAETSASISPSSASYTFNPTSRSFSSLAGNLSTQDFTATANQTISVTTHAPASAAFGVSFPVAATASSNLAVAYTVTGGCSISTATVTMTSPTTACVVHFNQSGNANYNAAAEVLDTVTAQIANQTINVTSPAPASAIYGGSFTVAATATSGLAVAYTVTGGCSISVATITMTSGTTACDVHFKQAGNANYNAANEVIENVTAQKVVPTITWSNPADITYGTALSATQLNASTSPVVAGSFSYNPVSGTVLNVGSHTLHADFTPTDTADYATASKDVTIVVNTTSLLITASSGTMVYKGSVPSITPSYSGLTGGDLAPATPPTCSTTATNTSTVGSYPSTCTGAVDANYTISYAAGSVSVTQATPVITWNNPASISYGTALSATQLNASTSPVVAGTFTYSPLSGTVLNVGSHTLHVDFTPTDAINYTSAPKDVTIVVNKTGLLITASSGTMVYKGTVPAITPSYSGLKGSDLAPATPPTCSTTATNTSTVGSYPSTCAGAVDANYTISYAAGSVSVTQSTPVITWSNPADITYGTALSATQLNATASVPGSFVYNPISGMILDAGSHTLHVDFTPTDAIDYTSASKDVTIVVNKTALLITASSGTMVYKGSVPAITPSYSGLTGGDLAPATPPTCSTTATNTSTVGSYPSTCTGAVDANYTISYAAGSVSVTQATPIITWNNPAAISYGTALGATQLNATASTPGSFSYTPISGTILNVGSHTLHVDFTPTDAIDYTSASKDVTIVVNKTNLLITASSGTMVYKGGVPAITPIYSGLKGSDLAPATPPTCSTTATNTSTVGSYPSTCAGAVDANYTISYAAGSVSVTQATPVITWNDPAGITYGTALGATQLNATASVPGTFVYTPDSGEFPKVGSQTLHVVFTPTDQTNYIFDTKSVTIVVSQADLLITASGGGIVYGDIVPAITPIYSGLAANDSAPITPPTCTTTATSASSVGDYPSSCSGALDANYDISYAAGKITINPKALTITANNHSKLFGETVTFSGTEFTHSDLANSDNISSVTLTSAGALSTAAVASYDILASAALFDVGTASNYDITYVKGTLDVLLNSSVTHTISGKVTNSGKGVQGVLVTFGTYQGTTDIAGNYTIGSVPAGTSGDLTPSKLDYKFLPVDITISSLAADLSNQNFTGTQSFTIKGKVTIGTPPQVMPGVSITLGTKNTITGLDGSYTISDLTPGSRGNLVASLNGYSFKPSPIVIASMTADLSGKDFVATQLKYTISGKVTVNGKGLAGVLIKTTCSDGDPVPDVISNSSGTFTISNLYSTYDYTLNPGLAGYNINPTKVNSLLKNQSATLTGTLLFENLSGKVNNFGGISIQIRYGPGKNQFVPTDGSGNYSIANLPQNVAYTLTPISPLPPAAIFRFNPVNRVIPAGSNDQTGEDFDAIPQVVMNGAVTVQSKGIKGVTVSAGTLSTLTDGQGKYTLWVPNGVQMTLTATHPYFTFASSTVTPSGNFTKDWIKADVIVNGKVTLNGTGLDGVTLSVSAAKGITPYSVNTDAAGIYTLTVDSTRATNQASFVVTPTKTGYTFSPKTLSINLGTGVVKSKDFKAIPNKWTVSGKVTTSDLKGVSGVEIDATVNGVATKVFTNALGSFNVTGVPFNAIVTLSAKKYGYTFSADISIPTMGNANLTGQNFVATALTLDRGISGTITLKGTTTPLANVMVTLKYKGDTIVSVKTSKFGTYTFSKLYVGDSKTDYQLHTALSHYTFEPVDPTEDLTSVLGGASVTQNFSATHIP